MTEPIVVMSCRVYKNATRDISVAHFFRINEPSQPTNQADRPSKTIRFEPPSNYEKVFTFRF